MSDDDERMNLAALNGVIWGMFSAREHEGLFRPHIFAPLLSVCGRLAHYRYVWHVV